MRLFTHFLRSPKVLAAASMATALAIIGLPAQSTQAEPTKLVKDAEAERIKTVQLVRPAVAAVCFYGGQVCGSGVVISEDGYCLTNYHVVQPTGAVMQCGLDNGQLYDTVIVGQDKIGDVALVKLLPKKEGDKFPFVKLGDSDATKAGEWSMAMGNPFGLALDFTPTVTYGVVSGVNRYQPPEGKGTLEYTDCIQFDTSINPGNSGGPLFNMKGELIGINGRGSFEKRGRVNSGVGYAISINQIKNFLGHMKAGIDTDHASLGAAVSTDGEESGSELNKMKFRQFLTEADVYRRGVKEDDQLVSFSGRPMTSTNHYKNILGIYPMGWRLPMKYRRTDVTKEILVRLMGNMDKYIQKEGEEDQPPSKPGQPQPGQPPADPGQAKAKSSPAAKLVVAKPGYANFYFNKLETGRLFAAYLKATGDAKAFTGNWLAEGTITLQDGRAGDLKLEWIDDKDGVTDVKLARNTIIDDLKPLISESAAERSLPQGSGGLLAALYQLRLLMQKHQAGFKNNDSNAPGFVHGGIEPVYPVPFDLKMGELKEKRIDCEVLRTQIGSYVTKFFIHPKDATLVGLEMSFSKEEDPCEIYFYDYKDVNGVKMPHQMSVRYGDKAYGSLAIKNYTLGKK